MTSEAAVARLVERLETAARISTTSSTSSPCLATCSIGSTSPSGRGNMAQALCLQTSEPRPTAPALPRQPDFARARRLRRLWKKVMDDFFHGQ